MSAEALLDLYSAGQRDFHLVNVNGGDFRGANLVGASFLRASLRAANFEGARLTYVQFKGADLTGACFSEALINVSDSIGVDFSKAVFFSTDLTGTCLASSHFVGADMSSARFNNTTVSRANFARAKFTGASLSDSYFCDLDLGPFCDEHKLKHVGPSSVDAQAVMKSYLHPGLKRFMTDCGVPEIFATYMIDCARASGDNLLRSLMQSTFISYGGPDEAFARRVYEALRANHVVVFFFPETALVGERIDNEVFRRIQEHDRVLLVCSRNSLDRPGVVNEIQETLDREARDGGATYLLPIMIDDYALKGWRKTHPELAERIGRRIIADFRKAKRDGRAFDAAISRVLDALKLHRPT